MSGDGDRNDDRPFAVVRDVLADPSNATGAVPALLGLLDRDDRTARVAGAMGLCLVATADPEMVSTVIARLTDRLDGDSRPEATVAYDYLASQFPRRVDEAIQDQEGSPGRIPGAPDADNADGERVGRVRPPGVGSYDPHSVTPNPEVIDPEDPQRQPPDEDVPDIRGGQEDDADSQPDGSTPPGLEPGASERQQWNRLYDRLSEILGYSRFDDLMVLSGRTRDRYADISRVLAVEGGAERAVALRLFHRPEMDREAFVTDLETVLEEWQAIGDHPNVVSVFDVGGRPRPWAATEPVAQTLADRAGAFSPGAAVSLAADLADGLAYAHQHGVVHGGLDPENVVVPTTDDEPRTGRLDNVALLSVYRWYVTPATCLDPRYAAPEYYDRRFGRIDHVTDVYHLGAVLYRLLTGRPPFDGPFEAIRESVMHDPPPEPSATVDVPAALDRIVTKAMGKRTLRRYETINDLRGDLLAVHEEVTADGE